MGCLLAAGLNGCERRRSFEIVVQLRYDLVAAAIQLAQSVAVLHSKFLLPSTSTMQNQCLAVSGKLPASAVVETGITLFVGHAGNKTMIGKQIHLVANSRAIGARQSTHEGSR